MTLVKVSHPFSRSFDGMMKDFLTEFPIAAGKSLREDVLHFPPANIIEKENAYIVELAVPGFDKADFNIRLDANMLTISTEKKEDKTVENEKTVRTEFSRKSFKRSFTVDEKINTENIAAKYENGVLTLELPKKEVVRPATKEINIQ